MLEAAAFTGLACGLALALAVWPFSALVRDASLVDRFWPWLIAVPALAYAAWLLPQFPADAPTRAWLLLALLLAWAVRLSLFISWRNWGHGEDRRYQAIRARNEPHFGLKSLWLVFALQAVLGWIVSAPFLAGLAHAGQPLGALDAAGAALAAFGLVFEAVADAQMARFRADPQRRGQVMDEGLWRWSRHPNYFGEACVWWGFGLLALGAGGWAAAWALVSPLLMTLLLLKVSGVALLERDLQQRRPAYASYVARTSTFIPWPPRRQGT